MKKINSDNISNNNIDYKQKYYKLYENVAKLLVENRGREKPYNPIELLGKWDKIREENKMNKIDMLINRCDKLEEYETAYNYLLEYWESFTKEQQQEINKELNRIFILNKEEQV